MNTEVCECIYCQNEYLVLTDDSTESVKQYGYCSDYCYTMSNQDEEEAML